METKVQNQKAILIFDGDCSFCSTSIRFLDRNLPKPPNFVPYQRAELEEFGLSVEDCEKMIWLIHEDKQYGGHRALLKLAQLQPVFLLRFFGFLGTLPVLNELGYLGYALMAKFRHLLPGGTPACKL